MVHRTDSENIQNAVKNGTRDEFITKDNAFNGSLIGDRDIIRYFYNAPDAMLIYDNSNRIHFANLKVTTLLGYHYSELLGKSIEILFHGDHLRQEPLLYKQEKGEYTKRVDRMVKRKNGDVVEMQCCEQMLPNDRYVLVLYDTNLHRYSQDKFYRAVRNEIYEKLFIKLRLFRHGEGMRTNLNRLALFLNNLNSLRKVHILNRFIAATEEFRIIIFPEIYSIGRLIKALGYDTATLRPTDITLPGGDVLIDLSMGLKQLLEKVTPVYGHKRNVKRFDIIQQHRYDVLFTIKKIKQAIAYTTNTIERYFICPLDKIIAVTVNKYKSNDQNVVIRFSNKVDADRCAAIMNCSELGEIIEIMIKNALDALKSHLKNNAGIKPYISISLSQKNNKLRIVIKDNGPGVPKEYQSLLFKDGFSTKGPGRGFGLSYAAQCIRKYGGELFYEDQPAQGACFVIELLSAGID